MEAVPANRLGDLRPQALQACVIGIDEGQFVSVYMLHIFSFFILFTCRNQYVLLETDSSLTNPCFFCVIVVYRHRGVLWRNGQFREDSHCSCLGWNLSEKSEYLCLSRCIFHHHWDTVWMLIMHLCLEKVQDNKNILKRGRWTICMSSTL